MSQFAFLQAEFPDIFVRRVARTPHDDGVKKGEPSPVVIGIIGLAYHPEEACPRT